MNLKFLHNKEVKNASWLIGGKVAQMVLSFFVGILTARYLGPGNYGLIGYASTYITFFTSLCTLGINSIIIKDFIEHPDEQGTAIGTTLVLRFMSSVLSIIMITGLSFLIDRSEADTRLITLLCSVALLFQIFDTINYWFQSRYQSKITTLASLVAYIAVSVYRIILLAMKKSVFWFAFATSVDYIVVALFLLTAYKRYGGFNLNFSWKKAKYLLSQSYNYILSGLMVVIYGQTDKFMLKHMVDESEVGYYSVAVRICTLWVFVLQAIIDSMYPTILRMYNENNTEAFERKNRQLYAIVFYVSLAVSAVFLILGGFLITFLYGKAYAPAVMPLKIVTWYTAFSYLGVARNAWIVCENKQKYLKYMYAGAAVANIILNSFLIPAWGASGAALASLVAEVLVSIVFSSLIKPMRRNCVLMLQAIVLRNTFSHKRKA